MRIERYGSNADTSIPSGIKSPLQAGTREMLPDEIRRELERYPDVRAGLDANDLSIPIITEEELGDRVEIELPQNERNPYLQGMASPTTVYRCPFCHRLTARVGLGHGDIANPHTHEFGVE